jgi:hypothetical protein
MTQTKIGASHIGGRLFKSAATSALALSALAGGVMLSGGEAKAVACNGTDLTFFDTALGQSFTSSCTLISDTLGFPDPTYIRISGNPMYPNVQTTVDYDGVSGTGESIYKMTQKDPELSKVFDKVQLRWEPPAVNPGTETVEKFVYSAPDFNNPANFIGKINTNGGFLLVNAKELWIRDEVTTTGGGVIPGLNNDFRQTPGPLPILGAGAAFGFSRKLRARIKTSRTA